MGNSISRREFSRLLAGSACIPFVAGNASAEELKMRISVDVAGTHNRAKFMQRYADLVNQRAKGALKVEVMHSGQLFKDRDVPRALRQGSLEMGCPATWFLSSLDPNLDIFDSTLVYGASEDKLYAMLNGEMGRQIGSSIESKFQVKVLGEWFGHAPSHVLSVSKPINTIEDLAGLKVRIPGGAGTAAIVRAFKASPVQAPWPDVPMALNAGTFDAVVTGNDGVVSAKLWDAGIKHAYLNRMHYAFYVPMVSAVFWKKLSPELQTLLVDSWAEIRPEGRKASKASDDAAAIEMEKNGIKLVRPAEAQLAAQKAMLLSTVDLAKETRITPEFIKQFSAAFK
ncbi:MAG: TRAP transporter substrate-binding protein DctP [Proteobacteria bacterium]|nr:TRAP transporter substrate-binding protein DctP [Pseudomonadota bacterium]